MLIYLPIARDPKYILIVRNALNSGIEDEELKYTSLVPGLCVRAHCSLNHVMQNELSVNIKINN